MWFEYKTPPVCVDKRMALAPIDFLSRVVAARPSSFSGLDALGVNNRPSGTSCTAGSFAVENDEGVINPLEEALVTEFREPTIDRALRRQIPWQ